MECATNEAPKLVCVPDAISAADRRGHFTLVRQLFREHLQERQELENGYALRFRLDALDLIARFVANERKCCPFVSFEISLPAGEPLLWLRMTGPAGTREVLGAELDLPGACGGSSESCHE